MENRGFYIFQLSRLSIKITFHGGFYWHSKSPGISESSQKIIMNFFMYGIYISHSEDFLLKLDSKGLGQTFSIFFEMHSICPNLHENFSEVLRKKQLYIYKNIKDKNKKKIFY